jgi:hypothetical protein
MSATLERIKAEADAQPGLAAHLLDRGGNPALMVWRNAGDDVRLQVEHTPLGLRYMTYECICGTRVPEHWSDTAGHALPQRVQAVYWWTYRHIWGWLTYRRWRGLPEASGRLDAAILFWEQLQQALEQEVADA